jgi:hypothetical protein
MKRTMLYSIREAPLVERLEAALANGYRGVVARHDQPGTVDIEIRMSNQDDVTVADGTFTIELFR